MRYGILPDSTIERLALWIDAVPVPVIDMLVPLLKVRAIMAGVRFGIFQALARGPQTATELAARLELDAECLRLLLRVLVSAEYLERDGDGFALAPLTQQTLLPGGASELWGYVEFNYTQWHFIEQLEETLKTGRGIEFHHTLAEGSPAWPAYQRAMLELARPVAEFIADRVPVRKGAARLLDLGGSHGAIGAALCRTHPGLRSTVLELPAAIEHARQLAEAEGLSDVVEHRPGDVLATEYGSDYDVVLICNLLHHFSERQVTLILSRSLQALHSGGTVAIWETEVPDADAKPELATDALALYFRITSTSQGLRASDLEKQLQSLGFERITVTRSMRAPGRALIHAQKA